MSPGIHVLPYQIDSHTHDHLMCWALVFTQMCTAHPLIVCLPTLDQDPSARTQQRWTPSSTFVQTVPHPTLSTHILSFPLLSRSLFALLPLTPHKTHDYSAEAPTQAAHASPSTSQELSGSQKSPSTMPSSQTTAVGWVNTRGMSTFFFRYPFVALCQHPREHHRDHLAIFVRYFHFYTWGIAIVSISINRVVTSGRMYGLSWVLSSASVRPTNPSV